MIDSIHEECGVFGIFDAAAGHVAESTYFALYALQHRGQESCGIAVNEDGVIRSHRAAGLVPEVFTAGELDKLGQGQMAVGHVRYSTTGGANPSNTQPLVVRHMKGAMALAHNGNLVNAFELRRSFELQGAIFHGTSDTEVIAYAITKARLRCGSIEEAVSAAMDEIKGAYSLIVMSPQKLIAARDATGFRPLCMGRLPEGQIVFASETCALDSIGAVFVRDVEAGEIVVVDENGVRSIRTHCRGKAHTCVFEFVYFARPDSVIEGKSVHEARCQAGRFLAKEHPVEADVVIGVPDSGLDAALGYAEESGIPYGMGFVKNRYIARTFIQPEQGQRENSVRIKLNALASVVKGKRVIMVDDSIVRGTTSARIVTLLRDAGATEVHVRVSAPPFISPCYYGTDIDSKENLIACQMSEQEICRVIGADSLGYLSVEGVRHIADGARCDFCCGCFTGEYPAATPKEMDKSKFEQKIKKA